MFDIKKNKKLRVNTIFNLLVLTNILLANFAFSVSAEETTKRNNLDYGLPTHRRDGGSRSNNDSCVSNSSSSLIALIPRKTVGINASASPKLFFYVPKVKQQKTLEFVLRNERDELVYETFFTTEGEGIVSVKIPADVRANSIKQDTNYHWYLSMICNSEERSRDIVVEGWMRQSAIDTVTKQALNNADSIGKAQLYYQEGFWFDALSVLAENYKSQSEKPMVRAKWSELLKSVGLGELATAPFIKSQAIKSSIQK